MMKHKLIAQSGHGSKAPARSYREPRFEYVQVAPGRKAIICKLDTGALHELPVKALAGIDGYDGAAPVQADVVDGGRGAMVRFHSGFHVDFAADFVLHHCDPAYECYQEKAPPSKVGARIRALREKRGLTLVQLAEKTGIAQPNLTRLEHDKVTPSIETLYRVAKALDTNWIALVAGKAS